MPQLAYAGQSLDFYNCGASKSNPDEKRFSLMAVNNEVTIFVAEYGRSIPANLSVFIPAVTTVRTW